MQVTREYSFDCATGHDAARACRWRSTHGVKWLSRFAGLRRPGVCRYYSRAKIHHEFLKLRTLRSCLTANANTRYYPIYIYAHMFLLLANDANRFAVQEKHRSTKRPPTLENRLLLARSWTKSSLIATRSFLRPAPRAPLGPPPPCGVC